MPTRTLSLNSRVGVDAGRCIAFKDLARHHAVLGLRKVDDKRLRLLSRLQEHLQTTLRIYSVPSMHGTWNSKEALNPASFFFSFSGICLTRQSLKLRVIFIHHCCLLPFHFPYSSKGCIGCPFLCFSFPSLSAIFYWWAFIIHWRGSQRRMSRKKSIRSTRH